MASPHHRLRRRLSDGEIAAGLVGGRPYRSDMRSINGTLQIASVFDHLDAALSRGATFLELMELLDSYERLSRELAALEYESTSPFGRPW
jgi:hypothetical protein